MSGWNLWCHIFYIIMRLCNQNRDRHSNVQPSQGRNIAETKAIVHVIPLVLQTYTHTYLQYTCHKYKYKYRQRSKASPCDLLYSIVVLGVFGYVWSIKAYRLAGLYDGHYHIDCVSDNIFIDK
jgi:hypothetical protein